MICLNRLTVTLMSNDVFCGCLVIQPLLHKSTACIIKSVYNINKLAIKYYEITIATLLYH